MLTDDLQADEKNSCNSISNQHRLTVSALLFTQRQGATEGAKPELPFPFENHKGTMKCFCQQVVCVCAALILYGSAVFRVCLVFLQTSMS